MEDGVEVDPVDDGRRNGSVGTLGFVSSSLIGPPDPCPP